MQAQARAGVVEPQAATGEVLAQRFGHPRQRVGVGGDRPVAARGAAVVAQSQFDAGPRQRQRAQPVLDVAELGALGAQELAARRHVVEQVAHFHRAADRVRLRPGRRERTAFDLQATAVRVRVAPRDEREAADRGDRGQRLAAETERADLLEVLERGDLAGGVAGNGERQVLGGHAAAIVAHADQADAALLQVDVHAARAGIERVLDQLLDHGGGPFDDFAGGDLVDEGVG